MSDQRFDALAARLHASYQGRLAADVDVPVREQARQVCEVALSLLLPGFFPAECSHSGTLRDKTTAKLLRLESLLAPHLAGVPAAEILAGLPTVRELVLTDVEAAFANDPAAADRDVVVASYPCIEALTVQRFAHCLYRRGVPLLPRMMTEVVHGRTGIDIHPGASIGESCFIDHGTGVVIGETAILGSHCVLYQGVGLIAWNPLAKDENGELRRGPGNKRHPELQDHVTVYAGASILGGDTVIGHHSVIGGNVWLTHSVEPWSVVTMKDPELNIRKRKAR
jgi:serine O-acetyltransferase